MSAQSMAYGEFSIVLACGLDAAHQVAGSGQIRCYLFGRRVIDLKKYVNKR
jgi:hypothetical protein